MGIESKRKGFKRDGKMVVVVVVVVVVSYQNKLMISTPS